MQTYTDPYYSDVSNNPDDWIKPLDIEKKSQQESNELVLKPTPPAISFFKPSELVAYVSNPRDRLVGDCHIMRGSAFVIGGQPGIGKSRSATELAICGATGADWLGLTVHTKFKTMIIQSENGRYRLKDEYSSRGIIGQIDEYILVSEPPPFGISFAEERFKADLLRNIESFKPDVVLIDPWNNTVKDDTQREYKATFDLIVEALPKGNDKPAVGIVAHTRKPKSDEVRTGGKSMMNLIAGSHILVSTARSVFIMTPADDKDETDNRVIWFNPKNNNGKEVGRTAWFRNSDGFSRDTDFDWESFDQSPTERKTMTDSIIREALTGCPWERKVAVKRLMDASGLGEKACRNALLPNGKFAHLFTTPDERWIRLKE